MRQNHMVWHRLHCINDHLPVWYLLQCITTSIDHLPILVPGDRTVSGLISVTLYYHIGIRFLDQRGVVSLYNLSIWSCLIYSQNKIKSQQISTDHWCQYWLIFFYYSYLLTSFDSGNITTFVFKFLVFKISVPKSDYKLHWHAVQSSQHILPWTFINT